MSEPSPTSPRPVRPRRRWRRWIALQLVLGTVAGGTAAEWMFHRRDHGAFPHVNFYVPDAELGVRLEPGASMRFRFRDNPTTDIHVNSSGYRGDEWPTPGDGEILVLGDSQVFGLGVEDDATFSARLAELTGRTVINAGVPTYGPEEYLAITRELVAARKPTTVVYVLNSVNDGFELERPNRERHAVWDGWAVRIERAPQDSFAFPGRRWLYRNSHAFYALRRWWNQMETDTEGEAAPVPDAGLPSEGDWRDLISKGAQSSSEVAARRGAAEQALQTQRSELGALAGKREDLDEELTNMVQHEDPEWDGQQRLLATANPGDIVDDGGAEESRSVLVTAALVRRAVVERDRRAQKLIERGKADALAKMIEKRSALAKGESELRRAVAAAKIEVGHPPSIYAAHLAELKALCDANGTELVVVALPIDVQVSSDEWAKYGAEPTDMTPSLALLADTVADAEALGAIGVEPTAALAAAEPGAFLDGDIHMTAKGHDALAHAIVDAMNRPPARVEPRTGLPEGRTAVPSPRAWIEAGEVMVKGSTDAGCRTQIIDEWLRVSCNKRKPKLGRPRALTILEGDGPELMHLATEDTAVLLAPLRNGAPLRARFDFDKQSLELQVSWPVGESGKPRFAAALVPSVRPEAVATSDDEIAARLCQCHAGVTLEVTGIQHSDEDGYGWVEGQRPACTDLYGGQSADCFADYRYDCIKLLSCVRGDPLTAPSCDDGEALVAASNVCVQSCDPAHPCATGSCEPYNDGGICR